MKRVVVLGGDGFCGWPTALHLSKHGFRVTIIDNFSRRNIDKELQCESLTPIASMEDRLDAWKEVAGKRINFKKLDIAKNFHGLCDILNKVRPAAIVHFAEQRAAPYSMKTSEHKRYTVDNNINATHNVLCSLVETGIDAHLVHLGTAGVYGYGNVATVIPEGYLECFVKDNNGNLKEMEIMFPARPGSVYHTTKTLDALLFYFYNKNDNLRITDLHQGVVWGTQTEETMMHKNLVNRFDYDGDYGTVLNRFIVQSVVRHPLTVYGEGGQTRAFINMRDTVKCVRLAVESPPTRERVRIMNQVAEEHTVLSLAKLVAKLTGAEIRLYTNPRQEAAHNNLKLKNELLKKMGLNPILLENSLIMEIRNVVEQNKDRIDPTKVITTSMWTKNNKVDRVGRKHEEYDEELEVPAKIIRKAQP